MKQLDMFTPSHLGGALPRPVVGTCEICSLDIYGGWPKKHPPGDCHTTDDLDRLMHWDCYEGSR